MAISITRFDPSTAHSAHEGTILAQAVIPENIEAPFGHAYGYLQDGGEMELHKHPTREIYIVFSGTATMVVGDEQAEIKPGDVIDIPPNEPHSIIGKKSEPFLWAAFWW
jgi:Mannose-6-phosphate isomerase